MDYPQPVIGTPIRRDVPFIPNVTPGTTRGPIKEGRPVVTPVVPSR